MSISLKPNVSDVNIATPTFPFITICLVHFPLQLLKCHSVRSPVSRIQLDFERQHESLSLSIRGSIITVILRLVIAINTFPTYVIFTPPLFVSA